MARLVVAATLRFSSSCPGCGQPCEWQSVGRTVEGGQRMQSQSHPLCPCDGKAPGDHPGA